MNITKKIIITDTNIITDLSNADILNVFVSLDNVYVSDMVKRDEIKASTGDLSIIEQFQTIPASPKQISEIIKISEKNHELSSCDIINYVLARDNSAILATGDRKLKEFAEANNVEVIRTLKIIDLLVEKDIISKNVALHSCNKLKNNAKTRIPSNEINDFIKSLNDKKKTNLR